MSEPADHAVEQSKSWGEKVREYFAGFKVLKDAPREYWGLQVINVLDMTAYFAMLGIVVVFLSDEFGFSDVHAGYVWAAVTLLTTICLTGAGFLTDWLGIRAAVHVSMIGLILTRGAVTWIAFADDSSFVALGEALNYQSLVPYLSLSPEVPFRGYTAAFFLILTAPVTAMVQTLLQSGNRRYTSRRARGPGFNLWYLFMNVGAAIGGFSIDIFRKGLGVEDAYIVGMGVVSAVLCMVACVRLIRTEEQVYGPDEAPVAALDASEPRKSIWQMIVAVATRSVFWRFMVLVVLLLAVRAVFLHLHFICPKYWLRVIGPDAGIGALQAYNPILVIGGLFLLIPVLGRFSVYGMLTYGALISSAALFVLAIPTHGMATYWATLVFLLLLTVGEVIWSPRLQEYTAAIAPKGQEGAYLGLAMFPWFFAKFAVSVMSGHLLERYVPEAAEGEPILRDRLAAGEIPYWESPAAMWLILALVTIVGPLLALLLRGWFTKGAKWEESEEDAAVLGEQITSQPIAETAPGATADAQRPPEE